MIPGGKKFVNFSATHNFMGGGFSFSGQNFAAYEDQRAGVDGVLALVVRILI